MQVCRSLGTNGAKVDRGRSSGECPELRLPVADFKLMVFRCSEVLRFVALAAMEVFGDPSNGGEPRKTMNPWREI
jgi:hypothetical protein